ITSQDLLRCAVPQGISWKSFAGVRFKTPACCSPSPLLWDYDWLFTLTDRHTQHTQHTQHSTAQHTQHSTHSTAQHKVSNQLPPKSRQIPPVALKTTRMPLNLCRTTSASAFTSGQR